MTTTAAPTAAPTDMNTSSVPWWLVLLEGIFAVIIGALLLVHTAQTAYALVVFLGIYWLVSGIFRIVAIFIDHSQWGWKLFIGVLGIIAGLLVLQHPLWATLLLPGTFVIVLAIMGIFMGVAGIIQAFRGGGWSALILGALSLIFGVILLGEPYITGLIALPIVLGIFGIGGGIVAIVQSFRMRRASKAGA